MPRELNDHHKDAIALRKSQAHMYAAGWNDAVRAIGSPYPKHDKPVDELEFSRYYAELAEDYYSQATTFMPSIPHALESFRNNTHLNGVRTIGDVMGHDPA